MTPSQYFEVAVAIRAHGLKGELRVRPHWSRSEVLGVASVVWLSKSGNGMTAYGVEGCRRADKDYLMLLKGVVARDQSELLQGARVFVERSALEPLLPGQYLLADLVDAQVFAPSGLVGKVVDVRVYPTVDVLIVNTPDGRQLEQPLLPHWVIRVSTEEGIVELSSCDGLM